MRRFAPLAVAATALLSVLALALPASANISATKVITHIGEAGYYASMNQPGRFKQVQTTFFLRTEAEGLGSGAGEGVQLCNDTTGNAVQLGVRWQSGAPGKFQVRVAAGALAPSLPGTNLTACNSGGALAGVPLSPDLEISPGDTVHLILKEVSPGTFEAFAKDTTTALSSSKGFTGLSFPDVASAGVVQNLTTLSAPLALRLVTFRQTNATGQSCGTHGLGNTSCWTAVQAYSTANGLSSDPSLVDPQSSLTAAHPGRFHIEIGSETGV